MTRSTLRSLLNQIHNEDCIQGLSRIENKSVHLAFADPPFNIGYKYDIYEDQKESQQYVDWCSQWMTEVHRVLRDDGTFWLAIGDEYAAELKIAAQDVGFICRSWVIWYYTFGVHCKNKFTRSHAHLFYFTKNASEFTFNRDEIAVPSARQLIYADKRANPTGRTPDDTWILRPQDARDSFQPAEDIWYFPRVNGTFKERAGFHGCQMPEQLLGRIIRACSKPNDIVLDPFSGSATTLVVAKKLDRRFLGFELSEDYASRGQSRLDRTLVGDKLEGAEDPKSSVRSQQEAAEEERKKNAKSSKTATTVKRTTKNHSQLPLRFGFSLCAQQASLQEETISALLYSYFRASRGASLEYVLLDPDLNAEFQTSCDEQQVALSPFERNRYLFLLRSQGRLVDPSSDSIESTPQKVSSKAQLVFQFEQIPPSDWYAIDAALFATEVAWKRILDRGPEFSIEEIFCDPKLAAAFDSIAKALAPDFSCTELRHIALLLRQELLAEKHRFSKSKSTGPKVNSKAERLLRQLNEGKLPNRGTTSLTAEEARKVKLPAKSAIYWLTDEAGQILFRGATFNLARRLRNQLSLKAWKKTASLTGPLDTVRLNWLLCELDEARPTYFHLAMKEIPSLLNVPLTNSI